MECMRAHGYAALCRPPLSTHVREHGRHMGGAVMKVMGRSEEVRVRLVSVTGHVSVCAMKAGAST